MDDEYESNDELCQGENHGYSLSGGDTGLEGSQWEGLVVADREPDVGGEWGRGYEGS